MSERTETNKKLELSMAVLLVVVVAMLAVPIAVSVFRAIPAVTFLVQSVPVVLMAVAVGSMLWARKKES